MTFDIGWKRLLRDFVPYLDYCGGVDLNNDYKVEGAGEVADLDGNGSVDESEAKEFCIVNRDALARFIPFLSYTQGFTADNPIHTLILHESQAMEYSDFEVDLMYRELGRLLEEMRREVEFESDLVSTFPFLGENGEFSDFDRMSIVREVMIESGMTFGGADQTLFTGHFFARHFNCATGSYALKFFSHELGRRVDLVLLRDHVIARSAGDSVNFDMRYDGESHPDSYYADRYTVSSFSENMGVYLKSLNDRELDSLFLMGLGSALDMIPDRLDDAAKAYVMSIGENVANVISWGNLGAVMLRTGLVDESYQSFLKAVELDPNYAEAHIVLAIICVMKEERQEALQYLKTALELDGPNPAVRRLYDRLDSLTDDEIRNAGHKFLADNIDLIEAIESAYVD